MWKCVEFFFPRAFKHFKIGISMSARFIIPYFQGRTGWNCVYISCARLAFANITEQRQSFLDFQPKIPNINLRRSLNLSNHFKTWKRRENPLLQSDRIYSIARHEIIFNVKILRNLHKHDEWWGKGNVTLEKRTLLMEENRRWTDSSFCLMFIQICVLVSSLEC